MTKIEILILMDADQKQLFNFKKLVYLEIPKENLVYLLSCLRVALKVVKAIK